MNTFTKIENEETILNALDEDRKHYFDSIKKAIMEKQECIYFLSTSKAGKSSLINSLLKQHVVMQSQLKRTGHLTRLTYSEIAFIALVRDRKLLKFYLADSVANEDVTYDAKNCEMKMFTHIIIGLPNSYLQNGFDLVDTPPLCNLEVQKYTMRYILRDQPLVIMVLNSSFLDYGTTEIVNDLKSMKLQVIYFSTKLDRSNPGDCDYEDKERVPRRMQNAYFRLQKHKFIASNIPMFSSEEFFGSDLWSLDDIFISKTKPEQFIHPWLIVQWKRFKLYLRYYTTTVLGK